jgi:hypothetical protein
MQGDVLVKMYTIPNRVYYYTSPEDPDKATALILNLMMHTQPGIF